MAQTTIPPCPNCGCAAGRITYEHHCTKGGPTYLSTGAANTVVIKLDPLTGKPANVKCPGCNVDQAMKAVLWECVYCGYTWPV